MPKRSYDDVLNAAIAPPFNQVMFSVTMWPRQDLTVGTILAWPRQEEKREIIEGSNSAYLPISILHN